MDGTYGFRGICKPCRQARRCDNAKRASKTDMELPSACAKCHKGPGEVSFAFRSDSIKGGYRSICRACINLRGYSQACRKRQRDKDEGAYLARNATKHREWTARNPEVIQRNQHLARSVPEHKWRQIINYAKSKGVPVIIQDADIMKAMLTSPCFYCAFQPPAGGRLNGLDRVCANGPYCDANTVPCCAACNAIKSTHPMDEFVSHVHVVYKHRRLSQKQLEGPRFEAQAFGGDATRRELAKVKSKVDLLTTMERVSMMASQCYLCGRQPAFGIDRIDSSKPYSLDNTKPCCATCNYMKKDLALEDFLEHISHIRAHTCAWVIGNNGRMVQIGKDLRPVGAFDASGRLHLACPSVGRAVAIASGVTTQCIDKAINSTTTVGGFFWKSIDVMTYRKSSFTSAEVHAFLTMFNDHLLETRKRGSKKCRVV